MDEQANASRRELEAKLIERAARDAAFRRALMADPKGTLERELGLKVPEGVALTMVEEGPTSRYLVLPPAPPRDGGELSDKELESAAGGDPYTGQCSMSICIPP